MDYLSALEFIHSTHRFGSKLGLQNMTILLDRLGNPHKDLKFVHVAGTNGKGSTCSMINQVLIEAGYTVGLYTSPFIEVFNERMRVNNTNIPNEKVAELTDVVKEQIEWMTENGHNHPTEFEVVTAIGMLYFKQMKCDIIVLEVGLGGRLDATNVIEKPLLSVITPIDYDHMEYLGNTLEKIAFEKAGIIKERCPVIIHPQPDGVVQVFKDICEQRNSPYTFVNQKDIQISCSTIEGLEFSYKSQNYRLQLIAPYQADNASVAIEAILCLRSQYGFEISDEHLNRGLKNAKWLARMEIIHQSPLVIIDGAHNIHGISGLKRTLKSLNLSQKVVGVVGILADKDVPHMLEIIMPELDGVIVTQPNNPRAMSAEDLYHRVPEEKRLYCNSDVKSAVDYAMNYASENRAVVVGFGSLYLVGDIRLYFHD